MIKKKKRFLDCPKPKKSILLPQALSGFAYRFAVLLPVLSRGRTVFCDDDLVGLQELFTKDFGGCTYTPNVTHPLLEGTYKDKEGKTVLDKHTQFVVYTTQTEEAMNYFRKLQKCLQANDVQEKVLIEQIPVRLL